MPTAARSAWWSGGRRVNGFAGASPYLPRRRRAPYRSRRRGYEMMQTKIATRGTSAVHYVVRSESRLRARFATRIRREDGGEAAFTLRNMSPSGYMGECAETVRAGRKLTLLRPSGGRAEAAVPWAINARIGCRLSTRLTRRQRALVLAVTAKNGLLTLAG